MLCRLLYTLWTLVAALLGVPRYLNHQAGQRYSPDSQGRQGAWAWAAQPFAGVLSALCVMADCPVLWWPQVRFAACWCGCDDLPGWAEPPQGATLGGGCQLGMFCSPKNEWVFSDSCCNSKCSADVRESWQAWAARLLLTLLGNTTP